jgi:four helix bundle protein
MHNFKELRVWQKSIDLTVEIYTALSDFPQEEKFGLISQMKRAAVSIPSNVAEGAAETPIKNLSTFYPLVSVPYLN